MPMREKLPKNAEPLGTEGQRWDVACLAPFLASDKSCWIFGVTIPVDGGQERLEAGRQHPVDLVASGHLGLKTCRGLLD